MGLTTDDINLLDACARDVGARIGWELRFAAASDPELVGLMAGTKQIFTVGPARTSDIVREDICDVLDALKRGTRRIILDDAGGPELT